MKNSRRHHTRLQKTPMYRSYHHSETRTEPIRRHPHTFSLFNINIERRPKYTTYRENEPLLPYIENLFVLRAVREIKDYLPYVEARPRSCRCTDSHRSRRRQERSEEPAEMLQRGRSRLRIDDIYRPVQREEILRDTREIYARLAELETERERYLEGREGQELTQRRRDLIISGLEQEIREWERNMSRHRD
jgi:hypothetical protein